MHCRQPKESGCTDGQQKIYRTTTMSSLVGACNNSERGTCCSSSALHACGGVARAMREGQPLGHTALSRHIPPQLVHVRPAALAHGGSSLQARDVAYLCDHP